VVDRRQSPLEDMVSDELSDRTNIDLAFEVQSNISKTREPQFELSVEIEPPRGLDAPGLDLAIRERRIVAFLPGRPWTFTVMRRLLVKTTESRMPLKLRCTVSPSTRMSASSAAIAFGSLGPSLAKRPPLWKSIIAAA
jgi:hypothetical protein